MPYISENPEGYDGKQVGNGQCVVFVEVAAKAPHTFCWKKGIDVKGAANIKKGTAIATFTNGKYTNYATGNHAAIYISQDKNGIWVYDQWTSQGMVKKRLIRFRNGTGSPSNDGSAFSVIE